MGDQPVNEALLLFGVEEPATWYGLLAPAGTPKDVIARVSAAPVKVMELSDTRERITKTGADVAVASAEDFPAEIRADNAKYGNLIKDLGLKE